MPNKRRQISKREDRSALPKKTTNKLKYYLKKKTETYTQAFTLVQTQAQTKTFNEN